MFVLSGTTITQSGTDNDLSGIAGITGVVKTWNGPITTYTTGDTHTLRITGTLTINPEENRLIGQGNAYVFVASGGTLQLGVELTSSRDGSKRLTQGLALSCNRAQAVWWGGASLGWSGSDTTIAVASGGTFIARGAEVEMPGMISGQAGSTIWIEDLGHTCNDYYSPKDDDVNGRIDPITGDPAFVDLGVNKGITNNNFVLKFETRGYVGWMSASDVLYENYRLKNGGEITYTGGGPTGNNTAATAARGFDVPNGFFGFAASDARAPLLLEQQLTANGEFANTRLGGVGNFKGISIQSAKATTGFLPLLTTGIITNEASGSALQIIGDVQDADNRNWGYVNIRRAVNTDIKDGLSGNSISGGALFTRDTNNDERKNLNDLNDTADKTYFGTLSSGSISTDLNIILQVSNITKLNRPANTNDSPQEINRTSNVTRSTDTTVAMAGGSITIGDRLQFIINGVLSSSQKIIATSTNQTSFSVNQSNGDTITCYQVLKDNIAWIADLRGKVNTPGNDVFDLVYWNEAYNASPFLSTDLSDDTLDALVLAANILPDTNYSSTSSSKTQTDNIDELYDFIKQEKSAVSQSTSSNNGTTTLGVNKFPIEYPTLSTLAVSKSGDNLDIGARSFAVDTATTGKFTRVLETSLVAHSGATAFVGGTTFRGITTTSSVSCTNIDLPTVDINAATVNNLPNPIPANSDIEAGTFNDFPFSVDATTEAIGANAVLNGKFSEASDQSATVRFLVINDTADVSKLELAYNSTGNVEIYGVDDTAFDTDPINNGDGDVTYPNPKTIVVTAPSGNTVGQVYATYGGSDITSSLVSGTDAEGNRTFTYTTTVSGDFNIGLWINGFNYSQLKLGSAISGSFSLVPIDGVSLDFTGFDANTSLITAILANAATTITGTGTNTKLLISLDESVIDDTLTDHTAILGNNARLLMRRLLESKKCIEFLLGLASNANVFFTFDSVGFTIAYDDSGHQFELQWDEVEDKDLIINVFVKDGSGNALFAKIINTAPGRSPTFAPAEFVNITQSATSVSAFEEVMETALNANDKIDRTENGVGYIKNENNDIGLTGPYDSNTDYKQDL